MRSKKNEPLGPPVGPRVKQALRRHLPALYERLRFRFGHPAEMIRIANVLTTRHGNQVLGGPFAGMALVHAVTGSFIPKLLGSYERELHDIIERIIQKAPPQI